jgi:UDP-N-acetylmuramoylalanine--D-glutamate ligase
MTGIEAQLVTFGLGAGDVHCTESELIAHGEAIIAVSDMPLSRPHDQLNACAAVALALSTGVSTHLIAQVLATFEGLAHRTEYVAKVRGLRFFNDSKATTPHATIAALSGFDNAVLIVGGRNKGLDLSDLRELVPALTGVVTIGETSPILAEVFDDLVPSVAANSMEDAVTQAVQLARTSGADVVLSPACASFDWYLNYVERGDHFKRVVEQLKSEGEIS